ncbi:MAG: hypoxanthine phosphoribosyltransferase [Desulfobulbaceae bacterium]|jgi:hypoxanthine phosphoribosyltransferase|nr:hypoxanthine phosphoribosyltransferase [Desulfobulbaceae bacterium]
MDMPEVPACLIAAAEIHKIVRRLGVEITACYRHCPRELVVIGLLKGAFIFMADLVRQIDLPLVIDFLGVSSYGDTALSSGEIHLTMDLATDISGRDVLLVEDIVDTGVTVETVRRLLAQRQPRSLKVCAFLSKPECRRVDAQVDFIGREIENAFVVGYGLDYAQSFRHLPFVGKIGLSGKK